MNATQAQATLEQLGGNRFLAMTGCYQLVKSEADGWIRMKLRRNALRAQYLYIKLNSLDLYDMEFIKVRKDKDGIAICSVVKEYNNVYGDQLQSLFTEATGLYTHL